MKRIGLISDTHSHIDQEILDFFGECDEVWHAGDIGDSAVLDTLESLFFVRAVYGNIDEPDMQRSLPQDVLFELEGVRVFMTHIGGYPGKYKPRVRKLLIKHRPKLYICGHSHILKVIYDKDYDLLHINPGAAGKKGYHRVRTAVRFSLSRTKQISDLQVLEMKR